LHCAGPRKRQPAFRARAEAAKRRGRSYLCANSASSCPARIPKILFVLRRLIGYRAVVVSGTRIIHKPKFCPDIQAKLFCALAKVCKPSSSANQKVVKPTSASHRVAAIGTVPAVKLRFQLLIAVPPDLFRAGILGRPNVRQLPARVANLTELGH